MKSESKLIDLRDTAIKNLMARVDELRKCYARGQYKSDANLTSTVDQEHLLCSAARELAEIDLQCADALGFELRSKKKRSA